MTNEQLEVIIKNITTKMRGQNGHWEFEIDNTRFICLTDVTHNRMRIISPIAEADKVTPEQMRACMDANFHTALDSRYAISNNILWSAFIHPLEELTERQAIDGISQVYSAVRTFGSSYSSGALSFRKQ